MNKPDEKEKTDGHAPQSLRKAYSRAEMITLAHEWLWKQFDGEPWSMKKFHRNVGLLDSFIIEHFPDEQ